MVILEVLEVPLRHLPFLHRHQLVVLLQLVRLKRWRAFVNPFNEVRWRNPSADIELKAIEQHFYEVLFVMWPLLQLPSLKEKKWENTCYFAVQGSSNFSSLWMKPLCETIQMKNVEQYTILTYFYVVLLNAVEENFNFNIYGWYRD